MNPFTFPITENEPMLRHTTLRVGGPAQYFFTAKTSDEATQAVREAVSKKIPYAIIGGGSNTLVADHGFQGLIIKMSLMKVHVDDIRATVEAGTPSVIFARRVAERALSGVEWMVTLPGSIGGAVYGNAGAFGSETKDHIASVQVLQPDGRVETLRKDACQFAYRNSAFKRAVHPKPIILSATFELLHDDEKKINERMKVLLAKRKDEQPLGSSSAGCMFKNVEVRPEEVAGLLERLPEEAHEFVRRGRIPAGWLIQKTGLKNLARGKARVSDRHANFCLNLGGATADDVHALALEVQARVAAFFGLHLEPEVQFLGF